MDFKFSLNIPIGFLLFLALQDRQVIIWQWSFCDYFENQYFCTKFSFTVTWKDFFWFCRFRKTCLNLTHTIFVTWHFHLQYWQLSILNRFLKIMKKMNEINNCNLIFTLKVYPILFYYILFNNSQLQGRKNFLRS